ncbi:MAG: hypothetical protein ACTSQY_00510 [Candidatus Odinarchaeia archaeon]|nr:MAG: hypothetical protein [Lokiarchaeota virus Fenrir Meg22_1012]URC17283.1 MAG: hypothetical protein [Lokiarchaeota virus Fenrir Meg22_1214]
MKLKLKSGEYYEFKTIKKVILDDETIEITGTINNKKLNILFFIRMLEEESVRKIHEEISKMKSFPYKGKCINCDSDDIYLLKLVYTKEKINNPKKQVREQTKEFTYVCNKCGNASTTIKNSNKVLYYK